MQFIKRYLDHRKQYRRINALDITLFFRQFATLIAAGIPLIQSCDMLEKSQEKSALRLLIYTIKRDILTGKTLSLSLRHHPHYFDPLTSRLIEIGEYTGKLDTMLLIIANAEEKNISLKKKIKQVLFYPCMMLIAALIITLSMFIFVIPKFAELFHDMQGKLPLLTRLIFYFSTKLNEYIRWFAAIVFLIPLLLSRTKYSAPFLKTIQHAMTQLPIMKQYLYKLALARFARQLAITFSAGIPITDALKLVSNTSSAIEFTHVIMTLRSKISAGLQLHHAMEASHYFPALMVQMVKIGEESGKLELMLEKLADFFESEIDQLISYFNQLLEPLIMVLLGALIGALTIGMYLPVFKLGSTL